MGGGCLDGQLQPHLGGLLQGRNTEQDLIASLVPQFALAQREPPFDPHPPPLLETLVRMGF